MLTKSEKAELEALQSEVTNQGQSENANNFELSSDEMRELEMLKSEFAKNPELLKQAEEKGFFSELGDDLKEFGLGALDTAIKVGNVIDSYTGAPTRAFLGQHLENLKPGAEYKAPIEASINQFGEDPNLAPTGKQIAREFGVSDTSLSELFPNLYTTDDEKAKEWLTFKKGGFADISASGAAGLALDLGLDPTLIVGGLMKGAGKGANVAKKVASTGDETLDALKAVKKGNVVSDSLESLSENTKAMQGLISQMTNPHQRPGYKRLLEIAKKNQMAPENLPYAVEFGPDSLASRMQRYRAEGPLGQPILEKISDAYRMVDDAAKKQIVNISRQSPRGREYAGNLIREAYDGAVDKLYKNVDITYSNIDRLQPGLLVDDKAFNKLNKKLDSFDKWASGKVSRAIPGEPLEEARHLKNVIEAVKKQDGSVKQLVEVMQDIGETAFKSQNYLEKTPKDIKRLRELYYDMSDAVVESVKSGLGDEMAQSLVENNKLFKNFFDDSSFVKAIGNKNVDAQKLFNNIVKNGDLNQIESIKKLFDTETLQKLKGEYLNSLLKYNNDETINFTALKNALNGDSPALKLFHPDEVKDIKDLIYLRSQLGKGPLSTSGTGATNQMMRFLSNPVTATAEVVGGDTLMKGIVRRGREAGEFVEGAGKAQKAASGVKTVKKGISDIKKMSQSEKLKRVAMVSPATVRLMSSQSGQDEIKGRDRWALNGLTNIINTYPERFNDNKILKLYRDPKGKKLLIEASSIASDSKRMKSISERIEKFLKD